MHSSGGDSLIGAAELQHPQNICEAIFNNIYQQHLKEISFNFISIFLNFFSHKFKLSPDFKAIFFKL